MVFIHQVPFFRILLAWLTGILLGLAGIPFTAGYILMAISLVSYSVCTVITPTRQVPVLKGMALLLGLSGTSLLLLSDSLNQLDKAETITGKGEMLLVVRDSPEKAKTGYRIPVWFKSLKTGPGIIHEVNSGAILYLRFLERPPAPGDLLMIRGNARTFQGPEVQGEFDYRQWQRNHGVTHRLFVFENHYRVLRGMDRRFLAKRYAVYVRDRLISVYRSRMADRQACGTLESLVFGYRGDLSKGLVDAYARTGTLHVLAVSGMHVALVFLLLSKILAFMKRGRYGPVVQTLLILAGIWSYCFISGLVPSILRSGLMITFILIGKTLHRPTNSINMLLLTAFIILVFDPLTLRDVGFQLSFTAVAGIILLDRPLKDLYTARNRVAYHIWEVTRVTLSAQAFTFPIGLYYFHQFPNLFLFSNLLVIPLTTGLIYAGLLMFPFSAIPWAGKIFVYLVVKCINMTNALVKLLEQLPGACTDGIFIGTWQLILLYLAILTALFWAFSGKSAGLLISLFSLLAFSVVRTDHINRSRSLSGIFHLHYKDACTNLIIVNRQAFLLSGKDLHETLKFKWNGFLIKNHLWKNLHTIDTYEQLYRPFIDAENNLVVFKNRIAHHGKIYKSMCRAEVKTANYPLKIRSYGGLDQKK